MILDRSDITWDGSNVVYKGIKLNITNESLNDYNAQTGDDPCNLILHMYENMIQGRREQKLNQILNDRT